MGNSSDVLGKQQLIPNFMYAPQNVNCFWTAADLQAALRKQFTSDWRSLKA